MVPWFLDLGLSVWTALKKQGGEQRACPAVPGKRPAAPHRRPRAHLTITPPAGRSSSSHCTPAHTCAHTCTRTHPYAHSRPPTSTPALAHAPPTHPASSRAHTRTPSAPPTHLCPIPMHICVHTRANPRPHWPTLHASASS